MEESVHILEYDWNDTWWSSKTVRVGVDVQP